MKPKGGGGRECVSEHSAPLPPPHFILGAAQALLSMHWVKERSAKWRFSAYSQSGD